MSVISKWLRYLDNMEIRYSHSIHPRAMTARETAHAERVPAHEFAKTVVYVCERGFGMAIVPADEFVDLGKLAHVLGLSSIRLASELELAERFPDCELGAMPPFGEDCELPVIVDLELAGEFIAFTIGTHRDVVRMSFKDFEFLARPKIALIAIGQGVRV
jgi:Ala-tRNA(Pro) deacylase